MYNKKTTGGCIMSKVYTSARLERECDKVFKRWSLRIVIDALLFAAIVNIGIILLIFIPPLFEDRVIQAVVMGGIMMVAILAPVCAINILHKRTENLFEKEIAQAADDDASGRL
jgi:hypothetical protein